MASSSSIRDHQGGQAAVEWLGVLAVVAIMSVVALSVVPSLKGTLETGVSCGIDRVFGGGGTCAGTVGVRPTGPTTTPVTTRPGTTRPIAHPVTPPTTRAPIVRTDSPVAVTASLPRLPLTRSCHFPYRDCHADFTRSATRWLAKNLRSYSGVAAGALLGGLICADGGPLALACGVLAALNVEAIDRIFERAVKDHACASVHYGWGPSFPLVRIDNGPGCLN